MRHRGAIVLIALVLLGSCSLPRPTLGLTIGSIPIQGSPEGSYCQSGGCSGVCADSIAPVAALTPVAASLPIVLEFSAGPEVQLIHVDVFEGDGFKGQAPVESFDIANGERRHTSSAIKSGHYYLLVMIGWSRVFDRGDTSQAFLIDVAPK